LDALYLQDPGEGQLQQSSFEGLFVKVLKVDGAFAEELRQAGFDVRHQQARYPTSVFKRCIEIACRNVYPGQPTPQAMRKLAAQFVDGFFHTIVGKVVVAVLPFLSPESFLKRYPRFFAMAAPGVKMTVDEVSPRHWRLALRDRFTLPEFNAGLMECLLQRFGVTPTVKVEEQSQWHFVLSITW